MRLEQKKYYKLSPLEIIQDLKKKKNTDKYSLQFLEKEIAKTYLTNFWKYKFIESYISQDLLQEYLK